LCDVLTGLGNRPGGVDRNGLIGIHRNGPTLVVADRVVFTRDQLIGSIQVERTITAIEDLVVGTVDSEKALTRNSEIELVSRLL